MLLMPLGPNLLVRISHSYSFCCTFARTRSVCSVQISNAEYHLAEPPPPNTSVFINVTVAMMLALRQITTSTQGMYFCSPQSFRPALIFPSIRMPLSMGILYYDLRAASQLGHRHHRLCSAHPSLARCQRSMRATI
jgi:hypothetical protein